MKAGIFILLPILVATSTLSQDSPAPYPETPSTQPDQAVETFQLLHGFSLELIAAEPLVTDPVDICYDENGRAYVAEMGDYPYTDKAKHKPGQENPTDESIGKVRLLVDTDDDGIFDQSTVFADNLSWPTGVVCWDGGIYVTATPDLWYFKDHDGDGVADERRKVYTGFRKYNVQAVMNNPIWGLDNHIYISGSTNGGTITKVDDPDFPPLKASRHDFRFDPVTEALMLESGYGRFGNTFDNFGNRFVCNIRNPALHIVMPKRFLDRNPYLPPFDPREDICDFGEFIPVHRIAPPEQWRVERAERWSAEEPDRHPSTELVGAGAVTSSAGITCYRGDAYPENFGGNLFVGDASSGVVYRLELTPDGVTFQASRPDEKADFLASRDVWSRLVNLENSPDGCLTVLDMYREAIEHPWSIPDDIHDRIDLERGRDKGRIYRILPPGDYQRRSTPQLGAMGNEELVTLLSHPNAWHRETAQRLLVERRADLSDDTIQKLGALKENADSILGSIHAMHVLTALGESPESTFMTWHYADVSGKEQEAAHKLAAEYAHEAPDSPHWKPARAPATETGLFWNLLAARNFDEVSWIFAQENFQLLTAPSPWLRKAMLVGSVNYAPPLFEQLCKTHDADTELVHQLGVVLGAGEPEQVLSNLLSQSVLQVKSDTLLVAAAAGLAEGMKRQKLALFPLIRKVPALHAFEADLLQKATSLAQNPAVPTEDRAIALTVFRNVPLSQSKEIYQSLLQTDTPLELQRNILSGLSGYDLPEVPELLINRWPKLSPALQQQALEILLTRPSFFPPFLSALESKIISPHVVSQTRRSFLTEHSDKAIATRAKAIFSGSTDRNQVIETYTAALSDLTPNPKAGQLVFQQFCMACHQLGEEGLSDLGPNLSTVRDWDRGQLLTNILDPSREVSPAFVEYLVEKNDGTVLGGSILNETDAAVLLRRPDGSRKAVYRRDIKEITNSGHSLMPEGLEAVLSTQQMADLLSFLTRKP
ncbi:MAG: c-type cytochrome [Verrucomicrobiales bacterium]|nr:c-type cytochrome [Verrucomicrobiales bacterium]